MEAVFGIILNNIYIILAFFGIFAACVLADMIAKTFYNVKNIGEDFSWAKFLTGIIRMLCLALSSTLLACVVGIIPPVLVMAGIEMTEEILSLFTVVTIASVFLNGIVKYFKSAYETIGKIVENEKFFTEYEEGAANEER